MAHALVRAASRLVSTPRPHESRRHQIAICLLAFACFLAFGQAPQRIRYAALVSKVAPIYPASAKSKGIEGVVTLDAEIGKDGHVSSVKPLSGNTLLVDAAKNAVAQWLYKPTLLNNTPIDVVMRVEVPFVLPRSK